MNSPLSTEAQHVIEDFIRSRAVIETAAVHSTERFIAARLKAHRDYRRLVGYVAGLEARVRVLETQPHDFDPINPPIRRHREEAR
jgi:hypothetical protein